MNMILKNSYNWDRIGLGEILSQLEVKYINQYSYGFSYGGEWYGLGKLKTGENVIFHGNFKNKDAPFSEYNTYANIYYLNEEDVFNKDYEIFSSCPDFFN